MFPLLFLPVFAILVVFVPVQLDATSAAGLLPHHQIGPPKVVALPTGTTPNLGAAKSTLKFPSVGTVKRRPTAGGAVQTRASLSDSMGEMWRQNSSPKFWQMFFKGKSPMEQPDAQLEAGAIGADSDKRRLQAVGTEQRLAVVCGPVGTGIRELGFALAKEFGGEVVNANQWQIYKGLDILTGKMPREQMDAVPHHLFSFLEPTNATYNKFDYRDDALKTIEEIWSRGKLPVLVGESVEFVEQVIAKPQKKTDAGKFELRFENTLLFYLDSPDQVAREFGFYARAEEMLQQGLLNELDDFYTEHAPLVGPYGLMRTIGFTIFLPLMVAPNYDLELQEECITKLAQESHKLANIQRRQYTKRILKPIGEGEKGRAVLLNIASNALEHQIGPFVQTLTYAFLTGKNLGQVEDSEPHLLMDLHELEEM